MKQQKMETPPTQEKNDGWEYREWQEKRAEVGRIGMKMEEAIATINNVEEKKKVMEGYSAQLSEAFKDENQAMEKYVERYVEKNFTNLRSQREDK